MCSDHHDQNGTVSPRIHSSDIQLSDEMLLSADYSNTKLKSERSENIYIFNPFIHSLYMKYGENEEICGRLVYEHKKYSTVIYGIEFELIRITINTRIEELRGILTVINNRTLNFENNGDKCIANIYLTNTNPKLTGLMCLFDIDCDLVIDMYREDYRKMTWSREDELMKTLIINLESIKII